MKIFERGTIIKIEAEGNISYFMIDKHLGSNEIYDEEYYEVIIGIHNNKLYTGSLRIVSELEGMKCEEVENKNEFYDLLKICVDKVIYPFKYETGENTINLIM